MSNEQQHAEEHGSLIKTPKQLVVTVVLAFIIPIAIIILLVHFVTSGVKVGAGSDTLGEEATSKRIAPVAKLELVDASAPRELKTGEQVYTSTCAACHNAGTAGAPKLGDNSAWAKYIKEGYETMLKVAITGKGAMPAKGGNPTLDDVEVARAVVYMANKSGASFEEPAAPEPAAEGEKKPDAPAAAAAPAPAPAAAAAAPAEAPQPAAQAEAKPAADAQAVNPAGEKLYKSTCFACHGAGVAGAPKFGDKAAWAKYIATGEDAMMEVVIKGKGAMPPKGGAANASNEDLLAAVRYMVNAAK
ncbi:c-type cytochrome [Orrella dioscoreae]|uniref:Putative cytochrome c n=1 Tax=Orrella dioscoreae TaxID=1851544 RepID=A0A1C3K5X7_9BURK|nr:c-type cytochrome [Orrella dioscoreae]SBT26757.1 putative cytochrome c [Orrella dioscoreae]SOE52352.1 putative cytochrome c [Orrella dioscoreae]